jgi:hypothetical protein
MPISNLARLLIVIYLHLIREIRVIRGNFGFHRHAKANSSRTVAESQSALCAWTKIEPETQTTANAAGPVD